MTHWPAPEGLPALGADEIHVWMASLEDLAPFSAALGAFQDHAERERGARYHVEADRMRHAITRGVLRRLAGHYLDRPPAELRFGAGAYGKPHLSGADAGRLSFNVSHSGNVVLIALAHHANVGVDVESWASRIDGPGIDRIADSAFSAYERVALHALAPGERRAAFFAIWSRKEAYIKATGLGVSAGLHHFDVSHGPGDARLLADRTRGAGPVEWVLHDLAPASGYSAALATDDVTLRVLTFRASAAMLAP